MPPNCIVDTSVFVSSLLEQEVNSDCSQNFMRHVSHHNIHLLIPIIVIFELVHILKKNNLQMSNSLLEMFFSPSPSQILYLDKAFLREFVADNDIKAFKTNDAILVSAALTHDIPLVTWDQQILKHCELALSPKQWLERANQ